MTFSIKTDEGVCIGAAETLVCGSPRPAVGPFGRGSLRIDTVQSNLETVTLGGYQPTRQVEGLELKVKDLESEREFWRELFNRLVDQRDEHAALAEARGKTIHELTEKFREKKERIHAFYAPQLENRKAENEELERVKRAAKAESDSADYWFEKATSAASRAQAPIHDSVIQEHEEQVGKLARERDQWKEAYHQALARSIEYADKMQDLRGELAVVKAERDRLLTRINCFMEEFSEGVTTINNAVEDWNNETGEA